MIRMAGVYLDLDELNTFIEVNLGRANGNCCHRRPGLEGVHDGQIAVRLKRKRFLLLDYSIQPTAPDYEVARTSPNIKIPQGAGTRECTMQQCHKVGVPVCLWDSEPDETDSLYMRSGLCFTCQRNLNEKRRTDRKRSAPDAAAANVTSQEQDASLIYAVGPSSKRFQLNGNVIQLNSPAVIINAPLHGTRPYCPQSYGLTDIGYDLKMLLQESAVNVDRLVHAVAAHTTTATVMTTTNNNANNNNDSNDDHASHPTASHDASKGEGDPLIDARDVDSSMMSAEAAAAAASSELLDETKDVSTTTTMLLGGPQVAADISAAYEQAFHTMNQSIFLLSQWKTAWDAVAAAAAHVDSVTDSVLADAVASAAAMAAVAAAEQQQQDEIGASPGVMNSANNNNGSSNMASLLLAADDKRHDHHTLQHQGEEFVMYDESV